MPKDRAPKWLDKKVSTRDRSSIQESALAKVFGGRTTINSGATFGQNDVITGFSEIEAKTTASASHALTVKDWNKLVSKCNPHKVPLYVVTFEKHNLELVTLTMDDFVALFGRKKG